MEHRKAIQTIITASCMIIVLITAVACSGHETEQSGQTIQEAAEAADPYEEAIVQTEQSEEEETLEDPVVEQEAEEDQVPAGLTPTEQVSEEEGGISVYVTGEGYGYHNYWYLKQDYVYSEYWCQDEEALLDAAGFTDADPFLESYDTDGSKRLVFYYDEQTERGCGVRYEKREYDTGTVVKAYGFLFRGTQEGGWEREVEDYFEPVSISGSTGASDAEEYQENIEYDENGRITHYDSSGIITWLIDEPVNILTIDWQYDEDGRLISRKYSHNGSVFSSWSMTRSSYFDELGRVIYERCYITHGSYDFYYIYTDDSDEPAYVLGLDDNLGRWIPAFCKVTQ